jgi:hypothetical protein
MKRFSAVLLLALLPAIARAESVGDWQVNKSRAFVASDTGDASLVITCIAERPALMVVTERRFPFASPPFVRIEHQVDAGTARKSAWIQLDNLTGFYTANQETLAAMSGGQRLRLTVNTSDGQSYGATFPIKGTRRATTRVKTTCGGAGV